MRLLNGLRTLNLVVLLTALASPALAQEGRVSRQDLDEPLLRIARATPPAVSAHPLDPALDLARTGLTQIRSSIQDYTCTLVKQERIDGDLGEEEYVLVKVRNRKVQQGQIVTPFSVYMHFLKPTTIKGREVIFVEGQNDDKMIAHEGGAAGRYLPTVWLRPTGVIAMRGQKYPITDLGIENLVLKLIERGELDKAAGRNACSVTLAEGGKINGRECTVLQVKNDEPSPNLDFHLAQIFIDKEWNIPLRYAAYDFPGPDGKLPVIEQYTYVNLKLNVGLTDQDFNHQNQSYAFE